MDYKIRNKSLAKAFMILECFYDKKQLGISELGKMLNISKSSIHDTVNTLAALGYLTQDTSTGKYYLGINCVRLGRAATANYAFKDVAAKHIREIANTVNEICYLTIPHGFSIYYLDIATPMDNRLYSPALSNSTDAMNCTSSGKCMLAFSSEDFVKDYINNGMKKMTEYTITDPDKLQKELQVVRSRGYAIDDMEYAIGIKCIARPIISPEGALLGALSISGPSLRMTDEKMTEYAALLKKHITEIVNTI